jgi:hypothetical protein
MYPLFPTLDSSSGYACALPCMHAYRAFRPGLETTRRRSLPTDDPRGADLPGIMLTAETSRQDLSAMERGLCHRSKDPDSINLPQLMFPVLSFPPGAFFLASPSSAADKTLLFLLSAKYPLSASFLFHLHLPASARDVIHNSIENRTNRGTTAFPSAYLSSNAM